MCWAPSTVHLETPPSTGLSLAPLPGTAERRSHLQRHAPPSEISTISLALQARFRCPPIFPPSITTLRPFPRRITTTTSTSSRLHPELAQQVLAGGLGGNGRLRRSALLQQLHPASRALCRRPVHQSEDRLRHPVLHLHRLANHDQFAQVWIHPQLGAGLLPDPARHPIRSSGGAIGGHPNHHARCTELQQRNACAAGINNLPPGNAAAACPPSPSARAAAQVPLNWYSTANTGPKATNTYTLSDNLHWIKNRHNITFGIQVQWLETNGGSYGGFSKRLTQRLTYRTEQSLRECPGDGDAYASFLVGAVYSGTVQPRSIRTSERDTGRSRLTSRTTGR